MSLINKMLKDLESRQGSSRKERVAKPIYEDLRPSMGRERRGFGSPFIWLIVLVCVMAGGLWAWERQAQQTANQPIASAIPSPTVVASSTVEEENPAEIPQAVSPTPAVVEKPAVTQPKPAPKPATPSVQQKPARPKVVAMTTTTKKTTEIPAANNQAEVLEERPEKDGLFEKKEIPLTAEQQAENAYREAARYVQERRINEAQAALEIALKNNPAHAKARELLAGLHLQAGRTTEAQKVLEEGMAKTPGNISLVQLLARIYIDQGAEANALGIMQGVQNKAEKDAEFLALLATVYQRAGRHDEAVTAYRQALTLRPLEGKWWLALGISLEAQTNWFAAREAYTRARNSNLDTRLAQYAEQRLQVIKNK